MDTEGVVQYRLLGTHPAASGRYHSFGFSGTVVPVEALMQEVVKEHQINLSKYKLEVRRLIPLDTETQECNTTYVDGDNNTVLHNGSVLHSYDRVVVNVSRRHYMDGVADAVEEERRAREERLRQVEGMLHDHEPPLSEAGVDSSSSNVHDTQKTNDPHALSRVTAVSSKAFPLLPWLCQRRALDKTSLPAPSKGTCVLCEMESFREITLPCCHFFVCTPCLDLAKHNGHER
uniref:Uncharacterized protein TCIL3000_11_2500 n=1 Tax=Trypanosoma congolense (strain IL3000) TaxID=1068625 RepID=G0UZN9_TRYCI|nr:unnamed protein product [Trypanosoma congolense IL3000]